MCGWQHGSEDQVLHGKQDFWVLFLVQSVTCHVTTGICSWPQFPYRWSRSDNTRFPSQTPLKARKETLMEVSWETFHCKSAEKYTYGGNYIYARWKLASPGTETVMLLQYRAQHELQNPPRTWVNILLANLPRIWGQLVNTQKKVWRCSCTSGWAAAPLLTVDYFHQ